MKYTTTKTYPLRAKLKKHNVTHQQLANAMKVTPVTVSNWVNDKSEPKEDVVIRIKEYFKSL